MDCRLVKGLNCGSCDIASCTTSVMRTPVSALDAELKDADMEGLDYDTEAGMYFIKRIDGQTCYFYNRITERCGLPIERRFNSCLIYPCRIYVGKDCTDPQIILNVKCPSALSLFDMYSRREPSTVRYIKTATKILMEDDDYRNHVIEKTKNFTHVLRVGSVLDILKEGDH